MLSPSSSRAAARRVLAALALLAAAIPSAAPAQEAPPWIEMSVIGVEPARVDEFLAAQRELSALDREAGVPWRSVSRTAVFGDTDRFLVMTPLAAFARHDRAEGADPVRSGIAGPASGAPLPAAPPSPSGPRPASTTRSRMTRNRS